MDAIIKTLRDWSEVWALLIPLTIILTHKIRSVEMRPLVIYTWLGLFISLVSTTMFVFHHEMPAFLKNNNLVYNIHSTVRVIFFGWFLSQFRFRSSLNFHRVAFAIYLVFAVVNFSLWSKVTNFSNLHFMAEGIILLLACLYFFLKAIQDESRIDWMKQPVFLAVAGIGMYEAVNFFTFLFFETLSKGNVEFLKILWTIHNMSFVLLCILFAISLKRGRERVINQSQS